MTRYWYGQSPADWTFTESGGFPVLAGGVALTMWDSPVSGSQITDLLDASGSPITEVVSGDGGAFPVGVIPRFQGPDGTTVLWADAESGTRYELRGETSAVVAQAASTEATVSAHVSSPNPHAMALTDLTDVDDTTPPAEGQVMVWDADTARWIPGSVDGVGGVTLDTGQTISGAKVFTAPDGTILSGSTPTDLTTTPVRVRFGGDRSTSTASQMLVEYMGLDGLQSPRRTFEVNERGMVRITAPVDPQVMLRLRADAANTAAAFQVTDQANSPRMWIESTDGRVRAPNISAIPPFGVNGEVATGSGGHRWYNDTGFSLTIRSVRASVGTAPTGADLIVDVHLSGTTIWSTQSNRPTIPAGSNTSGAQTSINTTTVPAGGYLTVDVDQVGSTVPGADLTVQILAY